MNTLTQQALNSFDPSQGRYLYVTKSNGVEHLAVTSRGNWLSRSVRRMFMALGAHSASMKRVARYLNTLNSLEGATKADFLREKLVKYEEHHQVRFTFMTKLFGKGSDYQAKMHQMVEGAETPDTIEEIFQKVVLPLYREPLPCFSTRPGEENSYRRITTTSQWFSPRKKEEHGPLHAARVVLWTQILATVYTKYGRDPVPDRVLLAAAGAFHDAAREDDGPDYWDEESSQLLAHFLQKKGVTDPDPYIQAIAEKDPQGWKFTTDIQRIVHDADCLDIVRVVGSGFNPRYLCFNAFHGDFKKKQFLSEAKDFIYATEKMKQSFEGDNYYGSLVAYLQRNQTRFPLLNELLPS